MGAYGFSALPAPRGQEQGGVVVDVFFKYNLY